MAAFNNHPERFQGKVPRAKNCPEAVWINKPELIKPPEMLRLHADNFDKEEVMVTE